MDLFKLSQLAIFVIQALIFFSLYASAKRRNFTILVLSIPYFALLGVLVFHDILWNSYAWVLAASKTTNVDHGYYALSVFVLYLIINFRIMIGNKSATIPVRIINSALIAALFVTCTIDIFSIQ